MEFVRQTGGATRRDHQTGTGSPTWGEAQQGPSDAYSEGPSLCLTLDEPRHRPGDRHAAIR